MRQISPKDAKSLPSNRKVHIVCSHRHKGSHSMAVSADKIDYWLDKIEQDEMLSDPTLYNPTRI